MRIYVCTHYTLCVCVKLMKDRRNAKKINKNRKLEEKKKEKKERKLNKK